MCYKCQLCGQVSKPGTPRKLWQLTRLNGGRSQIAREIAVCASCLRKLEAGTHYTELLRKTSKPAPAPVEEDTLLNLTYTPKEFQL